MKIPVTFTSDNIIITGELELPNGVFIQSTSTPEPMAATPVLAESEFSAGLNYLAPMKYRTPELGKLATQLMERLIREGFSWEVSPSSGSGNQVYVRKDGSPILFAWRPTTGYCELSTTGPFEWPSNDVKIGPRRTCFYFTDPTWLDILMGHIWAVAREKGLS